MRHAISPKPMVSASIHHSVSTLMFCSSPTFYFGFIYFHIEVHIWLSGEFMMPHNLGEGDGIPSLFTKAKSSPSVKQLVLG